MGQTYVYNIGKAEVSDEEIELTFGVFIDGTLNNKTNKEMRDKHSRTNKDGNVNTELTNDQIEKKDEEEYNKIKSKDRKRIGDLVSKENRTPEEEAELKTFSEKDRYLVASHRGHFNPLTWDWSTEKAGSDNSFSNDYTNVARMWTCCTEDYKVYVEGMGTEDNLKDSQDGFAFGSGRTGIRSRVRLGCEKLAEKILIVKRKDKKKVLTQVTIDVSGFSRGAASARNFVYEVNRKGTYKPKNVEVFDGYYPTSSSGSEMGAAPMKKYKTVLGDEDGIIIDESVLVDGMLPRMGHLGYCLAKSKEFSFEEINDLTIVVRFLGIYETVSSYYERNNRIGVYNDEGKIEDDSALAKLPVQAFSNQFLDDVAELHLNDFGYVQKIVHFTAQNEHRVNFDLTRMPGANIVTRIVEKNFPGVHCDIGGAYENETEVKEKLELARYHPNGLKKLRQELIDEHWFKEDQIDIDGKFLNFISVGAFARTINTKRFVKKEYSYIPLQFMEEYARKTPMKDYITSKTEVKYPIDGDELLINTKKHLYPYAFDETGEISSWEFETDDEIAKKKAIKEAEKERKEQELSEPLYDLNQEGDYYSPKPLSDYIQEQKQETTPEEKVDAKVLETVVVKGFNSQTVLRKLRNEYLHWSASRKWFGMEPHSDRKRREHLS